MWRCDNVGGLDEHVKKHMLWFLRYTFFYFILRLAPSTRGPILTIYTSYDVFPPKYVPFGGLVHTAPHFGGTNPPLAPRKSFDILALYKSDYYYYYKRLFLGRE